MATPKDMNALEVVQHWFSINWWIVILIVLGSWAARRLGDMAIDAVIRRTVRHRAHGDVSPEDVKKRQDTLIAMANAIWRVLVWLVAGFSIIRLIAAIDLTPLLAGASVLGVALGFGAQTLIKDFLSGLFIILENQYRVGDVVEIEGATGTVEQITLRSTILRDNNGSVHYIPNGSISQATNKSMGFAKINVTLQVPATIDVDKLSDTINIIGAKMAEEEKWKKRIMDPPHFLGIDALNTSTLDVRIIGKTQPSGQWSVTGELRRRLLAELKKEGIITIKVPDEKKK